MTPQQHVDVFNANFPVGTPVKFRTKNGRFEVRTAVALPAKISAKRIAVAVLYAAHTLPKALVFPVWEIPLSRVDAV